ncbi:MAG TPA: 4Fe-4S dicluster domain-containing protein, partial [Thermoplasmatales archaeon]|nr:4Fe-4S dicluster domain-containing protein [Thermoplasmatales archaeon]
MKSNTEKKSALRPAKSIKYLFKKPLTFRFPFETRDAAPRYRGFHLNDWEKCTGCGNCADICPTQAITMVEIKDLPVETGKKAERPQIDYGRCCYCGLCVDICPPGALRLSRDYLHIDHGTESFVYLPKDEKLDKEHFVTKDKYSIFQANLGHRRANYEGFVSELDFALFEPERTPMDIEPSEVRINSFIEEVKGYTAEKAKEESERCLECKLCEDICPAHMKISDYINYIYEDKLENSVKEIYTDNPLPGVCGRVCTHKCETVCSLGKRGEPVAIRWLKRYAVDNVDVKHIEDIVRVFASSKKQHHIAIVGSGPSGLSAAYYLSLMGYKITIYEAKPMAGGIMRYGI